ncbi:RadC family protein [Bizionia sp.]|uniref:RadC family protein n=1 Tax=Bizionia sp. TaxID=1954480 RepID=UPI003A8CD491
MNTIPIKAWSLDDRPREKLLAKGKAVLTDAELLAIVIGSGNREESALALSKRILGSVNNNIQELSKLSIGQLTKFKGIGAVKAISIVSSLELGRRRHFEQQEVKPVIKSSSDVFTILQPLLNELQHEEFWVLYLNNSNRVVAKEQLSKGGLTSTMVDVRLLFKKALELFAVAIIVAHNHPSGKLKPSNSDLLLTQKIKDSGALLEIKLLDHLIITQKDYFSFADQSLL